MKDLERELEKISKMKNSKVMLNFLKDIKLRGKSERRQLFYAIKLRLLEENVGIIPLDDEKVGKAMEWVRSKDYENWTIMGYQITLKHFARFCKVNLSDDTMNYLKIKKDKNHKLKPTDLITPQDMDRIITNSVNLRDKALFAMLYDSGLRHGEVLNLKLKDILFDKYGYIITVPEEGKTGTRSVRVFGEEMSYPLLRQWIRDHPKPTDENAYLFCKIEREREGNQLSYLDLNRILNDTLKRAGFKKKVRDTTTKQGYRWVDVKRIYPHLFRHTRASILSSKVAQRPLEMQMGWVPGSSMLGTYSHLDTEAQDKAILEAYGVVKDDKKILQTNKPVRCWSCDEANEPKARFCWKCGAILDRNEAKSEVDKLSEAVKEMTPEASILEKLPEDSKLDVLATLLLELEKEGKLDEIRKRVKR